MQDLIYYQRDRAALEWSREITIWTDPKRKDEICAETRLIRDQICQLNELSRPVISKEERALLDSKGLPVEFALMGRRPNPIPDDIKDQIKTLYEKLGALEKELDSLVDNEATARERSSRLQYALGVATM